MQRSSSFKQVFHKNMLLGLTLSSVSSKHMSLLERKRAIKFSADIAMAIASDGANWSRALIHHLSKQEKNKVLMRRILGKKYEKLTKPCFKWKFPISRKILRKSFDARCRVKKTVYARTVARRMVKKRIQLLKSLIPGGEFLDDSSLLSESIDYAVSLQAQVNEMWRLARALGVSKPQEGEASCVGT